MTSDTDSPTLLSGEREYGDQAASMVERQLRRRGIHDRRVLDAMRRVPRHHFLDADQLDRAYHDAALPTIHGQTISQPYMVAAMTEALGIEPHHRVLEIGTGSGYQTMILALLARHVVSIERDAELAERARDNLRRFAIDNVTVHTGDGTLGWADEAPYNGILVTAGAPEAPPALLEQLADGGRLVIPIGDREMQTLQTLTRRGETIERHTGIGCRFVPLIGDQGWRSRADG